MSETLDYINPLNNISNDMLKRTFEAARSPLIITDYKLPDNPIIYSNQAFLDLTGYSMKEIIGKNCRFLQGKDSDKSAVRKLRNGVKKGIPVRTLLKNYHKDGTPFYNDLIISPIKDAQGTVTHFMGMQIDVTELIEAQEHLAQRTRELELSNRELEQFTYAASHDLQEPLRMISSYLQLIDKRYRKVLDADGETFLNFAIEGAERMQGLIYDLLALSKITNAADRYVSTDMNEVVARAIDNLKVTVHETQADITVSDLPTLSVDPTQMIQLFQNLIGNGIKYRKPNVKPVISITATHAHDVYTFTVTDNGIGIEPQQFERVFVVFQRLHTRSEYSGNGVGLAIVSKIIERHGGKIWVESQPGKGASFKFTIPVNR